MWVLMDLIKYAGVNEARFDHDPSSGESLGLLIEEGRTNLLQRSQEYNISPWSQGFSGNANSFPNSLEAPDGTNTAVLLEDTQTSGVNSRLQSVNITSGTSTYTGSVYIKSGTSSISSVRLTLGGGTTVIGEVVVDTKNKVAQWRSGGNAGTSFTITLLPSDWVRVSVTVTDNSSGNNVANLDLRPAFSNIFSNILDLSAIGSAYFWGAQLEQGAFPTSYIPTQASTRTRAADNASITGKNFSEWYRQDEGTIYCEVTHGLTNYRAMFYSISRGLTNNYNIQYYKEPLTSLLYNSNITNQDFIGWNSYGTVPYNKSVKTARSYIENNLIHSINGNIFNTVVSSAFGTRQPGGYKVKIPVELNRLTIGNHPTVGSSYQNGTIKRFTYYPKVLSPEQLIALTR
jgi:hypothetical protein